MLRGVSEKVFEKILQRLLTSEQPQEHEQMAHKWKCKTCHAFADHTGTKLDY
jgi:hypothetical protein